ncbi:MAG: hypothetical protein KH230_23230 [Enterocloster asparagiformis]|nr:hypothetical protein [Enterocloster asparagiformis]
MDTVKLKKVQCQSSGYLYNLLCPYPFAASKNMNHVYAKVISIDRIWREGQRVLKESKYGIHISLMNNYMVEADYEYFTSGNQSDRPINMELIKNYKPYYYEFYAEISGKERSHIIEATKLQWFNAELIDKDIVSDNRHIIYGVVEFSASPFVEKGMALAYNADEVEAEILKKLDDNVYTFRNSIDTCPTRYKIFENAMNEAFDYCKKVKIRVYNVGQANCVYLFSPIKKNRVLFDIGIPREPELMSYDRKKKEVKKSLASIKMLVPGLVILSHWHLDHIKGAFLLNGAFNQYWIAPSIKTGIAQIPQSIKRVARYLDFNNKLLHISADKNGTLVWSNDKLRLWKGKGKSNIDNGGIILEIAGNEGTAILPGDCRYFFWPDHLNLDHNKYLVVPHHGSKLDNYCKLTKTGICNAHAYISVGEDGRRIHKWEHPSDEHIYKLQNCGYSVETTLMKGNRDFTV